ncbi:hypothetical protein [Dactylosporangium sp. NPDC005555]|uniref:hypothetical protein n=1 Tax=Dactylosporangium sp. NPDC005555 TaxID=3154889 RepID=UPI0033B95D2D
MQPPARAVTPRPDLVAAVETITAATAAIDDAGHVDAVALLEALVLLRQVQDQLAAAEPALIGAARQAGVSWQALAPALGVASRQAAERRYLRAAPATSQRPGGTREGRVRAERDHRAGTRAVARWANDNTADLRRLAGQITGLPDLPAAAADDVDRLHHALADPDATALPQLLSTVRQHLDRHPALTEQIDRMTASTDEVLHHTQRSRHERDHHAPP